MNQESFVPGQRWISDTEPTLGLGLVVQREGRQLLLAFRASSEQRIYALDNAPLTRVRFAPGDKITNRDGERLCVSALREEAGLILYHGLRDDGSEIELPETELDDALQFNRPQERLFAGQLDTPAWFDLRHETLEHRQRLESSPLRGLGGGRTSLLAHQLYIAHEVGRRALPRVLLADEVGLGKTIEACMILHQQLLTGRAQRALILVPPALLNQWLVELLRRFNLRVSLFDEQRYQAVESSNPDANPFLSEQLVLCTSELLLEAPSRGDLALQAGWDLLIVDEAHHLEWHPEKASGAYLLVERLARQTNGVLLLTATPEQLGSSGHFARLRLLDADRFPDLERFRQEQTGYRSIAALAKALQTQSPLQEPLRTQLIATLEEEEAAPLLADYATGDEPLRREISQTLTQRLLDRHGTGRVLFRNTRSGIAGFPQRQPQIYPLPLPTSYRERQADATLPTTLQLTPEMLMLRSKEAWWQTDPRIDWLSGLLRQLKGEKVLLICAYSRTARAIEQALRSRQGTVAALFHEQMTIVERDRAAAWFADPEGAQLLICSEIGSEGRNFQFAHHLVLFDLPFDPDLLEQRIGRLDRIGQTRTIQIHLPYFESSAQAVMLQWYDQGLDAFRHTSAAAHLLFSQQRAALEQCLAAADEHAGSSRALIAATAELRQQAEARMREGRDLLLELNSCRQPAADRLQRTLAQDDQDGRLPGFAQRLLDSLGVDSEEHSAGTLILKPGNEMLESQLPGLPEQGLTGTFRRDVALSHEDREFLTWEHPLITGTMELLIDRGLGNSSCCAVRHPDLKAGTLLLELLYLVECPAPRALRIGRFLPPTMIRLLVDGAPSERGGEITRADLAAHLIPLETAAAKKLARTLRAPAQAQIDFSEPLAEARMQRILAAGRDAMQRHYSEELTRLRALRRVNPGVTRDEILAWERQAEASEFHLNSTHLRLDAVQLVIAL